MTNPRNLQVAHSRANVDGFRSAAGVHGPPERSPCLRGRHARDSMRTEIPTGPLTQYCCDHCDAPAVSLAKVEDGYELQCAEQPGGGSSGSATPIGRGACVDEKTQGPNIGSDRAGAGDAAGHPWPPRSFAERPIAASPSFGATSTTGSNTGTTIRDRSSGARPPTRSSTTSPDISNESTTHDTAQRCREVAWQRYLDHVGTQDAVELRPLVPNDPGERAEAGQERFKRPTHLP